MLAIYTMLRAESQQIMDRNFNPAASFGKGFVQQHKYLKANIRPTNNNVRGSGRLSALGYKVKM